MKKNLPLIFTGPLQSWGINSSYNLRKTAYFPTKSAISGMICSALGRPREDTLILQKLNECSMNSYVLKEGVVIDDFHTVGAGYDEDEQKLNSVKNSKGVKRGGGSQTVVTRREYLADYKTGAIIIGEEDLLQEILKGLTFPKWHVCLGKRCCIPGEPIVTNICDTLSSAFKVLLERAGLDKKAGVRIIKEVKEIDAEFDYLMNDVAIDFSKKIYSFRKVTDRYI